MDRAGSDRDGEGGYIPAGEGQGLRARFVAAQVATAFGVDAERVRRAMAGEFGMGANDGVDSRQAQRLADLLLSDQPLDEREAALMRLGAFTPRPDEDWGLGETAPGEESDRLSASAGVPADERASRRSSHDPAGSTG